MPILKLVAPYVLFAGALAAQNQATAPSNLPDPSGRAVDLYEQVYARIFAIEKRRPVDEVFLLNVLVRPNGAPESQIVISQRRGPSATIEIIQLHERLEDLVSNREGSDPEALAKQIRVSRRRFQVTSSRSFAWQKDFLSAVSGTAQDLSRKAQAFYESGSVDVTLDGDSYEVHYEQGLTDISVHFSDSGPLMQWATSVRKTLEAIAKDQ